MAGIKLSCLGMIALAVTLILLHAPDGHVIRINPEQVTSMHSATSEPNKLLTEEVRCMVGLTDGKFVSVVEPCEVVQQMMEGK